VGEVEVRSHEHVVRVHGNEVPLTSREYGIIQMLAEHPGWVFSANQLSGDPDGGDYSPESVSVLVSRLRQKLASAGVSDAIETVQGIGYRLHPPGTAAGESDAAPGVNHELRDASWQLQEAVIEAEHSGSPEQQRAVMEVLEQARRDVYTRLAE
jgi:DNA-binding winged helix-turn-helix (wHTH) protein